MCISRLCALVIAAFALTTDAEAGNNKYFGVGQGCNLTADVAASGPDGRIYFTGNFTQCGDFKMPAGEGSVYDPRSERFAAIANLDRVDLDGAIAQIAFAGDDLYVTGSFSRIGDVPARRVARWDGTRWHTLGAASSAAFFGGEQVSVSELETSPQGIYVAGQFAQIGALPANNLAFWNRQSGVWSSLGSTTAGVNGRVHAIDFGRDGLYVGGEFLQAGGIAAPYVARWDGNQWHALDGGLVLNSLASPISAIASDGGDTYVYGHFSVARNPGLSNLARWDGNRWLAVGDLLTAPAGRAMTVSGNQVFLASNTGAISKFDGTAWSGIGTPGSNGLFTSLLAADATLYAGGSFFAIDGQFLDNVARWNGSVWSPLALGAPRVTNGVIETFVRGESGVYIAGRFNDIDGVTARAIARWNGACWSALGNGFDPNNVSISAIVESEGRVYVASTDFTGGQIVFRVQVWDGSVWSTLGTFNNRVETLAVYRGELFAGGSFTNVGGQPLVALARWNGSAWSAVGGGPVFPGWVNSMVVHQSELTISHAGTLLGGVMAPAVARWNGARWASVDAVVNAGLRNPGKLVIDGQDLWLIATDASGQGIFRLRAGQLSAHVRLPVAQVTHGFRDFAISGERIFVHGYTLGIRATQIGRSAYFDGSTWGPLFTPGASIIENAQALQFVTDHGAVSVLGFDLRQSGRPQLISEPDLFAGAALPSLEAQLSRNGSRVVYRTGANAASGQRGQIYLRDRSTRLLTRVSDAAQALQPTLTQYYESPSISADGQSVAFSGSAGQLYAVRAGVAQVVSRNEAGIPGNASSGFVDLNGDGNLAAFHSEASNLVADDRFPGVDIFIKNLQSGAVELLTRAVGGGSANAPSIRPSLSDDGRRVAFVSTASNLNNDGAIANGQNQVLLSDRSGTTPRVLIVSRNLSTGAVGNGRSDVPRISANGRFGVFSSFADNLVAADNNGVEDVFFFEYDGSRIVRLERVSVGNYGNEGNAASTNPSLSDDGSYVVFETAADNLVVFDRNQSRDVLIKNLSSGEVLRQSATVDGLQANGASFAPAISADAGSISFISHASNLVNDDTNRTVDVFWAPMRKFTNTTPGPGNDQPGISAFVLPAPNPPYPNCPAGFFIATVDDGPGVGLSPGLFGLELLLDPGGSQRMEGGLNFGGLIDVSQPAFAGFNVQNPANEPQRLDLQLTGYPASSIGGALPVRIQVIRQPSAGVNVIVHDRLTTLSMAQAFVDSLVIEPGFHVVTVAPQALSALEAGGPAEGQIFFQLGTRFVDRVGGGFFGGVVVGGYHASHPFNDVSGFAAFCIASAHRASVRTFAEPEYGQRGAKDLRLRLFDYQRNQILVQP